MGSERIRDSEVLLPEWDGKSAGYELLYEFYSSFAGPGLFLEDIYVRRGVSR